MDDVRLGNTLRAIRIRKHLRQSDVARRARVRREVISKIERGGAGRVRVDTLREIARALGARFDLGLRWQGADVDRVAGAAHAELHEVFVRHLADCHGWIWQPEVTFSIYGERGVIDILAWHEASRSLLIIELKTEIVDPQKLVATMSSRARLARTVAARYGWQPRAISTWVVVLEGSTNRRCVRAHRGLLRTAFPIDGRTMRRWMREPRGSVAALSFWSSVRSGAVRRTVSQTTRVQPRREREGTPAPSVARGGSGSSAWSNDVWRSSNGPQTDT